MFDFLNRAFNVLKSLNKARRLCGALSTEQFLWVFGGQGEDGVLDSIERKKLNCDADFYEINIEHQHLLKQTDFIWFPQNYQILLVGKQNRNLIQMDLENGTITERTDIRLQAEDSFVYNHNGCKLRDQMYLCGDQHMHILDWSNNDLKIVTGRGYWNAWEIFFLIKSKLVCFDKNIRLNINYNNTNITLN